MQVENNELTARPRLIAGSGRSGTTWILDVLAEANNLRTVFEPLHPVNGEKARRLESRFVPDDCNDDELEEFFRTVFAGKFSSVWSDFRVRPDRLRPKLQAFNDWEHTKQYFGRWRKLYRQRRRFGPERARNEILVKLIRANLMLGWIRSVFDARVLLIVRHPGAVVESQLRLGGDWDPYSRLDRYRDDKLLQQQYGEELEYAFRPGLSVPEALTAIWVIENKPAVERATACDYTVVFYEDLQEHSEEAWKAATRSLGLRNLPAREALVRPSQQTDAPRTGRRFDSGLKTGWIQRIGDAALRDVDRVLVEMNIDFFEARNPRPLQKRLWSTDLIDESQ